MSGVDVLSAIASRLVETSIVGGLLAAVVWGLCRLVPALPPAARCWLWWGVALKMLLGLLPLPGVALPVLPARDVEAVRGSLAARPAAALADVATSRWIDVDGGARRGTRSRATADRPTASDAALRSVPWRVPLAVLWLAGLAFELARAGAHLLRARRVVRAAEPASDPRLLATFDALRRRLGVPVAELRISRVAGTPQVVGVRRPVVLLPAATCERLGGEELAMALGHELLHVRRADLLLGLVPALAARCFFFHPLARLVEREHALAREEACDAAVVARLAPSPRAYGRLLLELSLGCGAPLRAAAAAVTHPTLQRRLQMLLTPARPFRPALVAPLFLLGVCALVPLRVTAREEASHEPIVNAAAAAPRAGEPAPAADPAATAGPRFAGEPAAAADPAEAAAPSAEPAPLATLAMAASPAQPASARRDHRELDAWIYFHDDEHSTMSGSSEDMVHARRHLDGRPLLWVRRGGVEWVIRDPAILARIDELFAPVRELGGKQAELGGKQAELGALQAQLGAQQAQLGAQQATLGSQQAGISAQAAQINAQQAALSARQYTADDADRDSFEQKRRELERQMRELERQVNQLGQEQNELGRLQGELGGKQNELGGKQNELGGLQNELGRRMQKASEAAERAVGQLLDDAIRSGQATRVE